MEVNNLQHVTRSAFFIVFLMVNAFQSNAITIDFDYTYDSNNFFATQERRDVLEAAASYFTGLQDQLTAIEATGFNTWTASFRNPSNPSELINLQDLYLPENTIKIYVGGANLAGNVVGTAASGGFSASGSFDFFNNLINRGQGETQGSNAIDYATWGGSLYFNNTVNWNSSLADPMSNQTDLFSVALHELGHIFGIGLSDRWKALRVLREDGFYFTGEAAKAANGGNEIKLNNEADHFAEGTLSTVNGVVQEASLDPSLLQGTRKEFTDLEYAALQDIGWQLPPVVTTPIVTDEDIPLPPLALAVLGILFAITGSRALSQ